MRISINTSSFSFRFISIWLLVATLAIYFFYCPIVASVIFVIAVAMFFQKHTYVIPRNQKSVITQVEKTLHILAIKYERKDEKIITKPVVISVQSILSISILHFRIDKVYTTQGNYIEETVVKYQRYK